MLWAATHPLFPNLADLEKDLDAAMNEAMFKSVLVVSAVCLITWIISSMIFWGFAYLYAVRFKRLYIDKPTPPEPADLPPDPRGEPNRFEELRKIREKLGKQRPT